MASEPGGPPASRDQWGMRLTAYLTHCSIKENMTRGKSERCWREHQLVQFKGAGVISLDPNLWNFYASACAYESCETSLEV